MGFFQNLFGKKACALCGKECGVMSRSKIKNKEYLCDDCGDLCSRYIRLSEYTLDEIKGHIEYMKKQDKLFKEVFKPCGDKRRYPTTPDEQGIEFCDELGMFRIVEKNFFGRGKMIELFRYDQVASYEPYVEETKPSEQGEEPEFEECGIKIKLIGANAAGADVKFGNRAHPYIKREFKLCFSKRDKTHDIINACNHFDFIFGVHSNSRGLFQFGLTTAEKRNINAVKGAFDIVAGAAMAAKEGQMSEENLAKIEGGANAIQDASTGGLAMYTRRADEAEAKVS